jgi:hypothetical protein
MASFRELQGLFQALDSKTYKGMFDIHGNIHESADNNSRRRSLRSRHPSTQFSNPDVSQPR